MSLRHVLSVSVPVLCLTVGLMSCGGGGGSAGNAGPGLNSNDTPPYGLVFEAGPLRITADPPGSAVAKGVSLAYRACDVNRDGRVDIVLAVGNLPGIGVETPASLRILVNLGDGTFREMDSTIASSPLPKRVHPRHVHCADLNGDGRSDVFVNAHGWDAPPYPMEVNALLLSEANRLTDRSLGLPQQLGFTHSAALGDIDNDGDLDIYVGGMANGVAPYILINDGSGTFTPDYDRLPIEVTSFAVQSLCAAFVDTDNDGFPELILGTYANYSSAQVLGNDRTGRFTIRARGLPPPPQSPRGGTEVFAMWIESMDFDGDGWRDLVISFTNPAAPEGGNGGTALQLLRNDRSGGFVDESQERLGSARANDFTGYVDVVQAIDINGDGALDLVASVYAGQTSVDAPFIWLNDGHGKFRGVSRSMLNLGPTPNVSLAIDVNGDGLLDLVQASVDQLTGWPTYQVFSNKTQR